MKCCKKKIARNVCSNNWLKDNLKVCDTTNCGLYFSRTIRIKHGKYEKCHDQSYLSIYYEIHSTIYQKHWTFKGMKICSKVKAV